MLYMTIAFGVLCVLLALLLSAQDKKNIKLEIEKSNLKGRMEAMRDRESTPPDEPLTAVGVEDAIRYAGYVPERNEHWIRFMASGDVYVVETGRLPAVFVIKDYGLDPKKWEIDLLKDAAHRMSDDLIMVKATIFDEEDETSIRFLVATLDANNASFKRNLTKYMSIIEDGRQRVNEIYEDLVKEKNEAIMTATPFVPNARSENKISS